MAESWESKLKRVLADQVRNPKGLNDAQKNQLSLFNDYNLRKHIKIQTRCKKAQTLTSWMEWTGTDLSKPTYDDVDKYIVHMKKKGLTIGSIQYYMMVMHSFLSFIYKKKIPDEINDLFSTENWGNDFQEYRKRVQFSPEDVHTEEEILRAIKTATTLTEKAVIAFQYGSASRPNIPFTMKRHHIRETGKYGIEYTFSAGEGKTSDGGRAYLKYSWAPGIRYIKQYLESYDSNPHPEGWLWLNTQRNPAKYKWYYDRLRKIFKDAELTKSCNPHSFRHSRVTHLRGKIPDVFIKTMCAWSPWSNTIERYSHLDATDFNKAMDGILGQSEEEPKKEEFCPHCGIRVFPDQTTCSNCLRNLDWKGEEAIDEMKEKLSQLSEENAQLRQTVEKMERWMDLLENQGFLDMTGGLGK